MKNVLKNMLLISCLLSVTVVSAVEKEENKEKRPSIKRSVAGVGVGFLSGLLGAIGIVELIKTRRAIKKNSFNLFFLLTPLVGEVVGRKLGGGPKVQPAVVGGLALGVISILIRSDDTKKVLFTNDNHSWIFMVMAGTVLALSGEEIRKREREKLKEVNRAFEKLVCKIEKDVDSNILDKLKNKNKNSDQRQIVEARETKY